jgi:alkanesulfonate monooxygenase SsuD/methylene tetrahydromethanopterin reductase-like flavin-dependent oxidoreductase (luciferase family)
MKKPFHLAWFLSQGYGPKSWRSEFPGSHSDLNRWMMPDIFIDLAKGMDRACFDYMIIEDSSNVPYTYKGSHDTYLQYAASAPKLDPAVLVPYLAQATKNLGIVPTLSVSEYPPYLMARLVNSLDHVTEGRVGWNCVTGSNDGAAQNYGNDKHRPRRTLRHRRRVRRRRDPAVGAWGLTRSCSVATSRCSPTAARSSINRQQILQVPRAAQRAALAAGPRADLPGRRLAAGQRFASRWADTIITEGGGGVASLKPYRDRVRQRAADTDAIPTTSRCCSSPIRSSTSAWRRRAARAAKTARARSTSTCTCRACRG